MKALWYWLAPLAQPRWEITLFLVTAASGCLLIWYGGQLGLSDARSLHVWIGYGPEDVKELLDTIGEKRFQYGNLGVTLDLLFPASYTFLGAALVRRVLTFRVFGAGITLVFLTGVLDLLENLMILTLCYTYDGAPTPLATLSSTFTVLKWLAGLLVLIGILAGALRGATKKPTEPVFSAAAEYIS